MEANEKVQMIMTRIAGWLTAHNAIRSWRAWRLLYALSPVLAGMTATLSEISDPHNTLYWWYQPNDGEDDLGELLDEIGSTIERASTPFGMDNYRVHITRLGSLSGDGVGLDWGQVNATVDQRRARSIHVVKGNRWHDWKRGDGRAVLQVELEQCRPCAETPVTVIQIAVAGAAVARVLRMKDGLPR